MSAEQSSSASLPSFNDLLDLITDFGVESLRVGSYEARRAYVGTSCDWKLGMLRDKRQEARERCAKALWVLCKAAASDSSAGAQKQDEMNSVSQDNQAGLPQEQTGVPATPGKGAP